MEMDNSDFRSYTYKVTPAIYNSIYQGEGGLHLFGELLEVSNVLRGNPFALPPLTYVKLFENFEGLNIKRTNLNGYTYGIPGRVYGEKGTNYGGGVFVLTDRHISEVPDEYNYNTFVPAGWGMRVIEAIRKGGWRAERELYGFRSAKTRSRVFTVRSYWIKKRVFTM
jgi:hypothetical protein